MDYKKIIAEKIKIEGVSCDDIYSLISVPQDAKLGDYSLACFKFSKALKLPPQAIAENLAGLFKREKAFSGVEAVSGYLNFKVDRGEFIKRVLSEQDKKGDDYKPYEVNGKTIVIDYSSINIAKPFHIGHLLTTAIGGSLYRIFKYLGYKTVGVNHLGDYGTQFGKLISAFKRWGEKDKVLKYGIKYLNELYVKFHSEAEKDPKLNDEARDYFKKIEQFDKDAVILFELFKKVTLDEVNKVYARLGIEFDSYAGESFYNDKLSGVVKMLEEKKLLTDSDGAKVVNLDEFDMPPCLILKSDGASLYATRDLAAAIYRKNEYDFYKNLYVVAYQQNLHFKQVFKVLELMGMEFYKDCVHVPFGMVSLEGAGALSTRKGVVVYLDDVLETAVKKSREIIESKNPNLEDKIKTAEQVGVGAVMFMALSSARIKDMVFSFDKALNFDGETGPYIQYTYARACSVLEKANDGTDKDASVDPLWDEQGFELIRLIDNFEAVVNLAAERYEPSLIAHYLVDLSQSFNRYYISHRIAGDKNRELLTRFTKNVLKNGLKLLLIDAPQKM